MAGSIIPKNGDPLFRDQSCSSAVQLVSSGFFHRKWLRLRWHRLRLQLQLRIQYWRTLIISIMWATRSARVFLEVLSPRERETFLSRYRAELSAAYPRQPNGKVLLRYPRLFFVAQK